MALRDAIGGGPEPAVQRPRRASLPLVLLSVGDERLAGRLRVEAGRRGMRVATSIGREAPAAVICDAPGTDAVQRYPGVPVLVLGEAGDVVERLDIVAGGAAGFLDRERPAGELIDQVTVTLARRAGREGGRILLVGETDPETRAVLSAEGFEVVAAATETAVAELERAHPELVLLDGGAAGQDLCRALRHDRRWSVLPIIALASEDDPGLVELLHDAGADGYLLRPVSATRVRSHLDRFRFHQALADRDRLTGLASRLGATAALGRLIRMAERLNRPLCLASLDIDEFARFNAEHGRIAGDHALADIGARLLEWFRGEDVTARWTGDGFVIGMFNAQREVAVHRMRALLAELRLDGLEFSAGVAEFPTDGADLEALYHAADDSLYVAKTTGRGRVVGASRASTQVVDVAIVDGEDAFAERVSHALTADGLRCWRFSNGATAVSMLGSEHPLVRASVIVLDLDLLAVDGIELLTSLGRDGVLDRARVLLVTAVTDEKVLDHAGALGAELHIAKPVALDVLTGHVDVALGRRD